MSYPCHIHVISLFEKRYIWIYLGYPRLKNLHLVCTGYIFSCHMPYLSMSYPCHKFVRLSGSGPANKIQPEIALLFEFCIPLHSVHQAQAAQQDFFATAARADSSFAPGLGWGRRLRGLLRARGPRRRGGRLVVVRWRGSAGVWGFLGVKDSARALGTVTPLAPAMPSTPL